jgi:hypothetical protein
MNSAELVNLILEKLRRVKFLRINQNDAVGGVGQVIEIIQMIRWKAVGIIAAIVLFWWGVIELVSGVL